MTVLAIIFVIVPLVIGVGNHIALTRKEANIEIEIEGALQGPALAQVHEKYQTKKSINAALALSFIAFPVIFLLQPLTK